MANWAIFAASAEEGALPADGATSQLIQKTAVEHFAAEIYVLFVGGTALQAIDSLIVERAVYHWGLFHADVVSCDQLVAGFAGQTGIVSWIFLPTGLAFAFLTLVEGQLRQS